MENVSSLFKTLSVTASDAHTFTVSLRLASGESKGSLVILQEVFGITDNIYSVSKAFCDAGFNVFIPHLFDRIQPALVVPYSDVKQGIEYVTSLSPKQTMRDIDAAIKLAKQYANVATLGYCWGGSLAFKSACELPVSASVAYYGGQIAGMSNMQTQVPVQYHFGKLDKFIPASDVATIKANQPSGEIYEYDADHGFSCNERASFEPTAHAQAFDRSVAFLTQYL